ncbi:hypothetical protein [Desulfovibrio sp. Huiquan2017]|nr:hypothetical protein [Desulfovibrio sp. Huiquan2017]
MEILLVYLALFALLAALAGILFPRRLIFWCAPEDRNGEPVWSESPR